ncbi:MAG TPA: type II toxin-antitoxin system RelE/ParE family toxin [Gammaproteobacteria bacterium]
MIKNFKHQGLEAFHRTGKKRGIQPDHANKLRKQLGLLEAATSFHDLHGKVPSGWELHALKWVMKDSYAMSVSGNWRLMWRFEGSDVVDLDYLDYH